MRNGSIGSLGKHLFERPLDALDRFAHDVNLIVEVASIVRIGDYLKGVADVVIHKLNRPEPLNQRTAAALFVKEDQQPDQERNQQIIESYCSRIQSCMLEDPVKEPAQGIDEETSEKAGEQCPRAGGRFRVHGIRIRELIVWPEG